MATFGLRYGVLVGSILVVFSSFVACGAQLYQVSLTADHQPHQVSAESQDPSSNSYGLHASKGFRSLPIHFRVGTSLTPTQLQGLRRAMNTWEIATGRSLFVYEGGHAGTTGDSFPDLYSSLNDKVNGHYLDDHWAKTGKPSLVLATTIWDNDPQDASVIITADIRYNSNYYFLGDAFKSEADNERELVDMQTLALHELGHLLGLSHISATVDGYSIMTPSLYIGAGLANRRLSKGDIERIQRIYGCADAACDVNATLTRIEMLDRSSRSDKNLRAEAPSAQTSGQH